ncbi:hypothetical protein CBS101457_004249 [Exobasidium rhododendri]|nr:hypothetical protein CBS101457_004249 [Exobasidium rhododendri]
MFLPRSSSSIGSSRLHPSSDSIRSKKGKSSSSTAASSPGAECGGSSSSSGNNHNNDSSPHKRHGVGNIGAWSHPTTAPASVQVHYHYLAGRYRDLSFEKGLGLVHSGMPNSTSSVTLGGIPEGNRDDEGEGSQDGSASIHSSKSKAKSASNSLRVIARKSGIEEDTGHHSQSRRLEDLFLGGRGLKDSRQKRAGTTKANVVQARGGSEYGTPGGPHGAKHASLRIYAEGRIKAHELIEGRIQRATDTGRLKWEAKAAIMNNSFELGILLLTRAAQIGSVSASLSLSQLYSNGVTRGNKPMVVLISRDPLRSLSWSLEAARILQHRAGAKAKRRGESSFLASADEEQPAQIVALLARLLRCKQAGITSIDEVQLPHVRRVRVGREMPEAARLWTSVCNSMGWLDFQLPQTSHPIRDDGESIGPDDDELDPDIIKRVQTRTQIALIEALVATRHLAVGEQESEKALFKAQACWSNFTDRLYDEACPHVSQQGDLLGLCRISEDLLSFGAQGAREALPKLKDALDRSLVETAIPVTPQSQPKQPSLDSPSKRRTTGVLLRKMSLEELSPNDTEANRIRERALRPALLSHHSATEARATASTDEVHASASLRVHSHRSGRASSLQGGLQRPVLSTSATLARLENHSIQQSEVDETRRSTLQRVRRPSSVMSASPSLLFVTPREGSTTSDNRGKSSEHDTGAGLPATLSVSSSLWEATPLSAARPGTSGGQLRRSVSSLYGAASVAPSEKITSEGSTTYDYDIEVSLRRQMARRNRGDSNASISTVASMLSTNPSINPSISESTAGIEYAQGQFSASSSATTSNINGFELRLGGAADTLRRIRRVSCNTDSPSRDGPAAPRLTESLEQMIANSTSYKAIDKKPSQASTRNRKNSNASMRSLTAFTANNQRQSSMGQLRPPSLYQSSRALSVFAMPTSFTDRSPGLRSPSTTATATATTATTAFFNSSTTASAGVGNAALALGRSNNGALGGALGSLRLLGKQSNLTTSSSRKPIPPSLLAARSSTAPSSKNDVILFPTKHADISNAALEESNVSPVIGPNVRAFTSMDPTKPGGSATPNTSHSLSPPHSRTSSHQDMATTTATATTSTTSAINGLDAALAEVEDKSGLKTTSKCTTCSTRVVNAPVSKSGDVFCSRDCRMLMKKRRSGASDAAAAVSIATGKGKGIAKVEMVS